MSDGDETSRIEWRRDYEALVVGVILGALSYGGPGAGGAAADVLSEALSR